MRKYFTLLVFFISSLQSFTQKPIPDFGKIDKADLTMQACSFEPSAHAMKLFDVQEIEFEVLSYDTRIITEKRVRIKIFDAKGYEYASIRIPYFSKKRISKIKDLSGVIYSLDSSGQIVTEKLSKKDFFKEKAEENVGIINFTFPHLKPGCVIEYRYTRIDKNIFQIEPWILQGEIPVEYASRILTIPSFSRLKTKVSGADTINEVTTILKKGAYYDRSKRTYFQEKIKSFEAEPFMSSYKDNLMKMVFLLIPQTNFFFDVLTQSDGAWKFAGNFLLNSSFNEEIRKNLPGSESLIDSAKKISAIPERIGFIYGAVKKRIPEKTEQTMYPDDITEAWNNKSGNTAEINLILVNLLQKAGVNCAPLLVSTRENGKVNTEFPSTSQLNGVDVLAKDSNTFFLMDASLKYQSYLNPPFNILNRQGFLLEKDNMQWVSISDGRPLVKQNINIVGEMKEDGMIEGVALCQHYDYAKSYMLDSTSEEDPGERFVEKKPIGLKIDSIKLENAENDNEPLIQKIEFRYEPQPTGDFYFINPQILTSKKESPFIKETRNTDIDFGCNQRQSLTLQLEIPSSFEVDHLPKNIIVRAPDSSFFFKRISSADSTNIYFSQTFEIMVPIFYKDEYVGIKEFFDRAYQLMSEEIVLKRKKK